MQFILELSSCIIVVKKLFGCEERTAATTATVFLFFEFCYFMFFMYVVENLPYFDVLQGDGEYLAS